MLIPTYILKTPELKRYLPLKNKLDADGRFEITFINSVMANKYEDLAKFKVSFSEDDFSNLQSRRLTPPEIACAFTHNLARVNISQSIIGGLILEDDARIIDINHLYLLVKSFLSSKKETSSILNLTGFGSLSLQECNKQHIFKILGHSNLAVGYALTSVAAKALIESNTPISYVSDWPLSKVNFFVTCKPPIVHGDNLTTSLIDGLRLKQFEKQNNLSKVLVTFRQFLFIGKYGLNKVPLFFKRLIILPTYWRIDIFLTKLKFRFFCQ